MSNTKKRKGRRRTHPVLTVLKVIGAAIFTVFTVLLIILSIISAAMVVYVMQFRENTPINIDLDDLGLASTTFIYGYDENGEEVELAHISRDANRIPVSIDEIPKHVKDAFVYAEDPDFYEHAGVNWMRTFGAVVNELTNGLVYNRRSGASTITQQLVKNITKDDKQTWDRKLREVFRAHDLEKYRTKDEILEAYLNCIGFGGSASGIEAAAQKYYGKSVTELDLAEAASLAAIPKSPETINPFADKQANKDRQEYVLKRMLDNAAISEKQYEQAMAEELQLLDKNISGNETDIQNWYVDMVIRDITVEFTQLYGLSMEDARTRLYNGGYKIYTPIDIDMQDTIEEKFRDYRTFSPDVVSDPPQAAFIAMDYNGNILAVAGGVGTKAGSDLWNRATRSDRQPASTFKPLAGYAYSIETGSATWSYPLIPDSPIDIEDENDSTQTRKWPVNYSETEEDAGWSEENVTIASALAQSLNTVSARLVEQAGAHNIFEYIQNKFQFSTLSPYDANLSPMAVGALTNGIYLRELVAAYQVFGGSGQYCKPTSYLYVLDSSDDVILQHTYTSIQAISPETASIMNRMLREVVESEEGTAQAAKLSRTAVVGKTGTSQNWNDNLFVACTPDYVSGVWYGYDNNRKVEVGTYYGTGLLWKNIFGDIADSEEHTEFTLSRNIEEAYYCTETGLLASEKCEHIAKGWYNKSHIPPICDHGKEMSLANTDPDAYEALLAETLEEETQTQE